MAQFRGTNSAFGAPGIEFRWTHADKDGIGTAHSTGARGQRAGHNHLVQVP